MQFLLDRKLDLKAAGDEALRKAAYKGQARAVEFLLQAGVKPNPEKHLEDTALHEAASVGAVDCARLLLAAGADPTVLPRENTTRGARHSLASAPAITRTSPACSWITTPDGHRNQRGFTPVLYAASAHAPRCLALLMDRGADLKAVNPVWESGLMKFAMIFNGEDAERPDLKMIKALILRDIETVKVLLDKGMDVNAPDPTDGLTPLSIAVSNGQTACLEMLLQRGAKMNTVDRFRSPPR